MRISLLLLLASSLLAQRRIVIGSQLCVPYNALTGPATSGPGISMKYDRFISRHFALTFSVDYVSFGKVYGGFAFINGQTLEPSSKLKTLSEQIGGKYYLRKRDQPMGFYISAETGINTSWLKVYSNGNTLYSSVNQTNFCYRYGFGLSSKHFDYGLLWQHFFQNNNKIADMYGIGIKNNPLKYWSLRISYIFPD